MLTYPEIPQVFSSVNRNQLFIFLVGNVCTGLINMSVDTLNVNNLHGLMIICGYAFFIGGLARFFDLKLDLTVKL